MNKEQLKQWDKYLYSRDLENGEPHSWFDIETNKCDHKDGLEKIFGYELTLEEYSYALEKLME